MPKKVLVGVVMNDKASKTRRVEIARLERHAKYKKIIRKKTVCHVHDENNESGLVTSLSSKNRAHFRI
jgi:small subunit ribosomal protein S17